MEHPLPAGLKKLEVVAGDDGSTAPVWMSPNTGRFYTTCGGRVFRASTLERARELAKAGLKLAPRRTGG